MEKNRTVAEKTLTFVAKSQVSGLREEKKELTCLCCNGFADGAVLDGTRLVSACNSMCFFSGKADEAIKNIVA